MQTFTGPEYLKIDIANNYGLDKKTWDERIAWFNQNEHHLEDLVGSADEPALFYAGVRAWRDHQADKPIGYMISLDATSSGLQLLAVLTGDRSAAKLCNVVDTGKRQDAYTGVYETMLKLIGDTAKISRDQTKDAIMTAFYGSTAVPKQVFGEGTRLLDIFYSTMREVAPGAWELNEAFLAMWDPTALSNDWVLPDNFHVHVKVMAPVKQLVHFLNQPFEVFYQENMPMEGGRSLGANTIHSIDGMIARELTRRCDYDPIQIERLRKLLDMTDGSVVWGKSTSSYEDKMVSILWDHYQSCGFLSARILDYLNMDNLGQVDGSVIRELLDSLPAKPFKVVSIHDCFRVLPHYGNDLRRQYNLQLELIARSNLLSWIISQILQKPVSIGKLDPSLAGSIRETNYALS